MAGGELTGKGGREGGEGEKTGQRGEKGKRGKGTENLTPRQDRLRTDFLTNVIV